MGRAIAILATGVFTLGCGNEAPDTIESYDAAQYPVAVNTVLEQKFLKMPNINKELAAGLGFGVAQFCSITKPTTLIEETPISHNSPDFIRGLSMAEEILSPGSKHNACQELR